MLPPKACQSSHQRKSFTKAMNRSPTNDDVYFTRGNGIQSRGGNIEYRRLIRRKKKIYQCTRSTKMKHEIANSIAQHIKNQNRSFYYCLHCNYQKKSRKGVTASACAITHHCWVVVPDDKVLTKVKQALREKLKPEEEKQEEIESSMLQTNESIQETSKSRNDDQERFSSSSFSFERGDIMMPNRTPISSASSSSSITSCCSSFNFNNEELENIIMNDNKKPSTSNEKITMMNINEEDMSLGHDDIMTDLTSSYSPIPLLINNFSPPPHSSPRGVVTPLSPFSEDVDSNHHRHYDNHHHSPSRNHITQPPSTNNNNTTRRNSNHDAFELFPFNVSSNTTMPTIIDPAPVARNPLQKHQEHEQQSIIPTIPQHNQLSNLHDTSIPADCDFLDDLIHFYGGEEGSIDPRANTNNNNNSVDGEVERVSLECDVVIPLRHTWVSNRDFCNWDSN